MWEFFLAQKWIETIYDSLSSIFFNQHHFRLFIFRSSTFPSSHLSYWPAQFYQSLRNYEVKEEDGLLVLIDLKISEVCVCVKAIIDTNAQLAILNRVETINHHKNNF